MKAFSIAELAEIIGAQTNVTKCTIRDFTGVSIDSRTIKPGDCFFAIAGENFNGHDYVDEAFAKGATCAVVSGDISQLNSSDKPLLKVDDTIKALGDFAGEYRHRRDYKVVAITGSAGKTTTKQIAYHVLNHHFRVYQSPKSFNNKIGLPLTLLGAGSDDEIVIAELGSNHPGEIACLTCIAAPDIAVVTNVHPAHLEGFGYLQTITKEKLSISEGLRPDGVLIINADFTELLSACRAKGIKFKTFGESNGCNHQARDIAFDGPTSRFTIKDTEVYLPLAGPGNVENALAAWAVCSRFGLAIDDFVNAVKTISPVSMRTELLQIGTLTVLNDCYNANPASMKNALDILSGLDPTGKRRLVFICGDMAELGQQSERLHAELGTSIARTKVGLLLAVGKFTKITAEAAKTTAEHNSDSRGEGSMKIKCFEDVISICNNLHEFIEDYDIILIKGSRTVKLENVVGKLKELQICDCQF